MKTIKILTDREVANRVRAIKKTWTKSERQARSKEAEKRQQKLANILGLVIKDQNGPRLHHAS